MNRISLYIVRNDNPVVSRPDRLTESFGDALGAVEYLYEKDFRLIKEEKNPWFAVMFDNEYLDHRLEIALPFILDDSRFDFYTLFRKEGVSTKLKVTVAPRIFQSHVVFIDHNSLVPGDEKLKSIKILDGWIECFV